MNSGGKADDGNYTIGEVGGLMRCSVAAVVWAMHTAVLPFSHETLAEGGQAAKHGHGGRSWKVVAENDGKGKGRGEGKVVARNSIGTRPLTSC